MTNTVNINRTSVVQIVNSSTIKSLANYVINTGMLCSHGCLYCKSPAKIRPLKLFKSLGYSPFEAFQNNIAIIDPETPIKLLKEILKLTKDDTVLISLLNDSWAPETADIGRQCLEVILRFAHCKVKVLTKSIAIRDDLNLIAQHRDRVSLGISMAAPVSKQSFLKVIEPNLPALSERMAVIHEAKELGIPLFGFLDPCMPGLIESEIDLTELFETILPLNPIGIWIIPITTKYSNIDLISEALFDQGFSTLSASIASLSNKSVFDRFIYDLKTHIFTIGSQFNCLDLIHM